MILALLLSWLGGFSVHVGGDLIHVLLAVALGMLIVRLARGGKVV